MSKTTVIVGAGITGLSCAHYLVERGHEVIVIDKDLIDNGASTGNAGIVGVGHPPLQRPGLTRKTLGFLLDPKGPLYIKPKLDPELWRWFWGFRKACTKRQFERSMKTLMRMAGEITNSFDDLIKGNDIDCEYRDSGWLELYGTAKAGKRIEEEAEMQRAAGLKIDLLDKQQLSTFEPAIHDRVQGAAHFKESAFLSPRKLILGLVDHLRKKGVVIKTNTRCTAFENNGSRFKALRTHTGERIEADHIVLAAGVWTSQLVRHFNTSIPMQAGKGYHLKLASPPSPVPQLSIACVCAETFVAITPIDNGIQLAGTIEFSGINHRLRQKRLRMLQVGAQHYIKGLGQSAPRSSWCGLRPCTTDGLPAVGRLPNWDNAYTTTGHAMMGLALGPISARLLAETIDEGNPSIALPDLDPGRFGRR
ncbi:MAG: FAD-dependent oxidoreductase [Phycisphaerales bacterium]|nr:FAD-dependent oxidoreductase [Phycisphaerales bacterium]